jgi:hypothetical protein
MADLHHQILTPEFTAFLIDKLILSTRFECKFIYPVWDSLDIPHFQFAQAAIFLIQYRA